MILQASFNGQAVRVIVDLGTTGNYVQRTIVQRIRIKIQPKLKLYELRLADETPLRQGRMNEKTLFVEFRIGNH